MQWFADFINIFGAQMPKPKWFGWFNILWILFTIGTCFLIYIFRKRISRKGINVFMLTMSITLFFLELIKQLLYSLHYNNGNSYWSYPEQFFPFQFCSTPMYIMLIAGILRKGKVYDSMLCYLSSFALFPGICVLLYPLGVYTTNIFINIHTMIWHMSMVIVGFMLLATGSIPFTVKSALKATIIFAFTISMALTMNVVAWKVKPGTPFNMFYIGPYNPCTLPFLDIIYKHVPWFIFYLIYAVGFSLINLLIIMIAKWLTMLSEKLQARKLDPVRIIKRPF